MKRLRRSSRRNEEEEDMTGYKICTTAEVEAHAMRDVYCETLIKMAERNGDIVAMDADLMNSIGMVPFGEKFPKRTFNCGIQEANMVGVAAGLSSMGKIPFIHTFGTFATRRVADQVFVSCAFAQANVRIIGSDPGITAAFNGGTHMPFEDMGIMRGIPTVTVIEPTDSVMLKDVLEQLEHTDGVYYVRLSRKNAVKIFEDGSKFEIGKAARLRDGKDVTVIASGIMTAEAMEAARMLENKGISAGVLNMFTIKPIDREAIVEAAQKTGAVVTAENHNILNGLGSAVAEVLGEECPVPMERVGVRDELGEVGSVDFLKKRFALNAGEIVSRAKKAIKRKGK